MLPRLRTVMGSDPVASSPAIICAGSGDAPTVALRSMNGAATAIEPSAVTTLSDSSSSATTSAVSMTATRK